MGKKVCIYARTSTEDQTLEQQIEGCKAAYPADTEFQVLHEQLSGWNDAKRPEYALLRKLIGKGWVKELCAFSISRLGRNAQEAASLMTDCQRYGVVVKVIAERLDFSGPLGLALYTLFAALAQMDSDTKSQAIRAKLRMKKQQTGWQCHGSPPHCVARRTKEIAPKVWEDLSKNTPYREIAGTYKVSVHLVGKLAAMRGQPLVLREEFHYLYPGWQNLGKDRLKEITYEDFCRRYEEVTNPDGTWKESA